MTRSSVRALVADIDDDDDWVVGDLSRLERD